MKKLEGKVAVVTGGSSGIGLATARIFAQEGAYVYITGRRQGELDEAVSLLGENVTAVKSDVSNLDDLDRLYDLIKRQHGQVDIIFANAGGGEFSPLGAITEEHFDRAFDTNVKGLLFTVQKALPLFKEGGSIILNSSTAGSSGTEALSVYGATKAAVRSFARNWTLDLKSRNIRVNAVSPGPINTPGLSGLAPDQSQSKQFFGLPGHYYPIRAVRPAGRSSQNHPVLGLGRQQFYHRDRTFRGWRGQPDLNRL